MLRHLISIQNHSKVRNSLGEVIYNWSDYLTCYAEIEPLSGREIIVGQSINPQTTHLIKIRSASVNPKQRIIFKDKLFQIVAVKRLDRNNYLELQCAELNRLQSRFFFSSKGSLSLSNISTQRIEIVYEVNGSSSLTGSAASKPTSNYEASGLLDLLGNSSARIVLNTLDIQYAASGSISLSGQAQSLTTSKYAAGGAISLSGQAQSLTTSKYAAGGEISLTGQAQSQQSNRYAAGGSISLTGQAQSLTSSKYAAGGEISLTGGAVTQQASIFAADGSLTLSNSAIVEQISYYSTQATGSLTLSNSASVDFALSALGSGSLTTSNQSTTKLNSNYAADGSLTLSNSASVEQISYYSTQAEGSLTLSNSASVDFALSALGSGSLTLSGSADCENTTPFAVQYEATGSLTISNSATCQGYAFYSLATSYDGYCYSGPTTNYNTARSTVVGASANPTNIFVGQKISNYECYELFLSFDTSAITGTITSAELALDGAANGSATDFQADARFYDFGATLTTADWVAGANISSIGNIVCSWNSSGFSTGLNYFTNNGTVLKDGINQSGFTRFIVTSAEQESGSVPTANEYCSFAASLCRLFITATI